MFINVVIVNDRNFNLITMATIVSNSKKDWTVQGTSCGKVRCYHGNHINYRMLLKLINAARQQLHLAKG